MADTEIGLFFGSFNPIHIGHLIIANTVLESADLKEVWFVVSPQNPFKRDSKSLAHEFDRLEMVEKAIYDDFRFRASDIEFHMQKPNYTAHTLAYLSERNPGKNFRLIIGEDNLSSFKNWKNHMVILEHYGLLVYPRTGAAPTEIASHKNVMKIEAPLLDISASYIRKNIKLGRTVKYLVPDPVIEHINRKGLYR